MIILLEGCDKAGKSTLVKGLKEMFPESVVFKNMIKPEDKLQSTIGRTAGIYLGSYQFAQQIQREGNTFHTIFDRGHLTEIVYSHRRGYESTKHIDWIHYERELLSQNAIIVYAHAPANVIKERFKTDKETYVDEKEIEGILERYEEYLRITKIPVVRISSLNDNKSNLAMLFNFINNQYNIWTSAKNEMNESKEINLK